MDKNNDQLKIEDKAPVFTAESTKGKISLTDYKGKYLVLYFYPRDATTECTLQAQEFTKIYRNLQEMNTEVIGISRDNIRSHYNFCEKANIVFPLIADTTGELCASYKVLQGKVNSGKKYIGIVRSTFVVSKDQIIHKSWYNIKAFGHAIKVLDAVEDLKKKDKITKR